MPYCEHPLFLGSTPLGYRLLRFDSIRRTSKRNADSRSILVLVVIGVASSTQDNDRVPSWLGVVQTPRPDRVGSRGTDAPGPWDPDRRTNNNSEADSRRCRPYEPPRSKTRRPRSRLSRPQGSVGIQVPFGQPHVRRETTRLQKYRSTAPFSRVQGPGGQSLQPPTVVASANSPSRGARARTARKTRNRDSFRFWVRTPHS